jgi:hypothetical protein
MYFNYDWEQYVKSARVADEDLKAKLDRLPMGNQFGNLDKAGSET